MRSSGMLGGHLPCPSWPWGLPLLSPLPVLPSLLGQLLMTVGEEVSTLTDALLREPTVFPTPGSSVHGIFQARVLEWGACTE